MKLRNLVLKEMLQRSNLLITSLIAITLGIAVIVGIKNITVYSEKAVTQELDALGANILILPKSSTIQNYYSADFTEDTIPEDYVKALVNSDIKGLDNLSPKLNMPIKVKNYKTILTGILPKNEFKSKSNWQGALGIFSRIEGCAALPVIPGVSDTLKNMPRRAVISDLDRYEVIAGSEAASALKVDAGDIIEFNKKSFTVKTVLPSTGTIDDSRIFAHLHTVQELYDKKSVLNAIEIVGCCSAISKGLINKINSLLPDAKVVTISQIVQTQINTNRIMNNISTVILIIIIIIGGAGIANYMFANVYERRREIGIMMALGAEPFWLIKIFLLKSLIIGIAGGLIGYLAGSVLAYVLGPELAGIAVYPMPMLALYGLITSVMISLVASIIPVMKAVKIDPSLIMQEK